MDTLNVLGIVLSELSFSEADKRIVILAKEYGKVVVSCKGAKKSGSKFLVATSPFCLCNFFLIKRNDFYYLAQVELIESFYDLRNDFFKLSYGAFFLEVVDKTSLSNMNCDDILILLTRTLYYLKKTKRNPKLVYCAFSLKLLELLGYKPHIYDCVGCGTLIATSYFFSVDQGGCLCKDCYNNLFDGIEIFKSTLLSMRFVFDSSFNNMFSFDVSHCVLDQLDQIIRNYLLIHTNTKIKTLDFIDNLVE